MSEIIEDPDIWNRAVDKQTENREVLAKVGENAEAVFNYVKNL